MKLCKDCAFYETAINRCNKTPDMVTGKAIAAGAGWRGSPQIQREDGFFGSIIMNSCGKRARWFKSANVELRGASE